MTDRLASPIAQRFPDQYFEQRMSNDNKRQIQFDIDCKLIRKYKQDGQLCDVGCSTGEFVKALPPAQLRAMPPCAARVRPWVGEEW